MRESLRGFPPETDVIGLGMNTSASSNSRRSAISREPDPAKDRKRAEQLRSLTTRSAILDAALAEFAEKGFKAASIRGIAERIGVQHPLITHHFGNKEGL